VYDDAVDGVLVNVSDVSMRVEDDMAVVQWGKDQSYQEPITTTQDYAALGTVVRGFELVLPPEGSTAENAMKICSKVVAIV